VLSRVFWKVHTSYRAPIPRDGPLIVAPSHESFLDPLIVGAHLPRDLSYMARRTLFVKQADGREERRRIASAFGRWASVIEVDREGGGRDAIRQCLEHLGEGRAVLIFPEGTRSSDGTLREEFQTGVGLLALRSGAPVLPVSVEGSRRVWGRGRKLPRFGAGPV
jgi:1-acyl-sn-glycerol-3-phosphate acyltransferase